MLVKSSKKKTPVVVQSFSRVWLFGNWWTPALQASLSFTISWSLLKVMSIESVTPSNHPILCCHLLFLPSIFPSIRVFSNESALRIKWPKYWRFGISLSRGWFSLGLTGLMSMLFKGLSRVFSSTSLKASILWCSAFFMIQLSHLYMTTAKTIALSIWTFVGKMMSLFFNMLSRFVIVFHPAIKCLLISWQQCFWSPRN